MEYLLQVSLYWQGSTLEAPREVLPTVARDYKPPHARQKRKPLPQTRRVARD
jgi:hypothetical protein